MRPAGLIAFQSPQHQDTTEPVPVVTTVVDGVPDPILVPFVAGVVSRLALVHISTVIERQPVNIVATDTVIDVADPATAVQIPAQT
jgi:hypothetical protein